MSTTVTLPNTGNKTKSSKKNKEFVKGNSLWKDAIRRIKTNKVALISFAIIIVYILIALGTWLGIIAPDFNITNYDLDKRAPGLDYIFGTDRHGRSVFTWTLHATKTALTVGLFSGIIALFIGIILGALSGYFGGWIDDLITWLYTTLDSIPYILLMASFQFALGQGLSNVFIALGLTSWVTLCRLTRAEFLKQKQKDYVEAARSLGAGHMRRMFLHITPNVLHLALIQFGLIFITAIKIEVILSFLGLGVSVGTPSWGIMINDARQDLSEGMWWPLAAATFFMFFLVLSLNLFIDALRDALDPKLKNQ